MPKEQFVTKKYLDKKLEEHSQVIVSAVDKIMAKHMKTTEEKFSMVEGKFSTVSGKFSVVEKKLETMEERLAKKIDSVQSLIGAYVKEQEDFKQEFVIMKEEMR